MARTLYNVRLYDVEYDGEEDVLNSEEDVDVWAESPDEAVSKAVRKLAYEEGLEAEDIYFSEAHAEEV